MPVAIELGVDLLALAALITLIGISRGMQYSLVALLKALAGAVGHVPFIGGYIAGHIESLAHFIYNQLGVGIIHMEHLTSWFFQNLAQLAREIAEAFEALARLVEHAVIALIVVHLPKWTRTLLRTLGHQVWQLWHRVHALERRLEHAATTVGVGTYHVITRIERGSLRGYEALRHAITVAIPREVAGLEREVAEISGWTRKNLLRRIRRLEWLAAGGLASAIALKMIARVAPWVRCSNVNRAGRLLCRMPVQLFEELIAGALDVLVVTDLCLIVSLMTRAAQATQGVVSGLADSISGLIQCQGASRPKPLAVDYFEPPPSAGLVTLP